MVANDPHWPWSPRSWDGYCLDWVFLDAALMLKEVPYKMIVQPPLTPSIPNSP